MSSITNSPALFESVNAIRPTTKSSLADALWCSEAAILPGPFETVKYVLDGRALLHRVPWTRGSTYDQIFEQYVIRKYGRTIVVFDGYSDNQRTKECAHISRSGGTIGVTVHLFPAWHFKPRRKRSSLTSITNRDSLPFCLRGRNKQGARSTRQEEKPTSSLCKQH